MFEKLWAKTLSRNFTNNTNSHYYHAISNSTPYPKLKVLITPFKQLIEYRKGLTLISEDGKSQVWFQNA